MANGLLLGIPSPRREWWNRISLAIRAATSSCLAYGTGDLRAVGVRRAGLGFVRLPRLATKLRIEAIVKIVGGCLAMHYGW